MTGAGKHVPPTVSVVMIFHDAARFFDEAVLSVVGQTFTDWELLLVDDGATDGSEQIARRYAAEHPDRIRYLHHPGRENRGTGPTRNLGIAEARGRYLTELDADDVWLPRFLEAHVQVLDANPTVDLAFSPVERWYSWSGAEEDRAKDWVARPWPGYEQVVDPPLLLLLMLRRARDGAVPKGVVVRREAVLAVGGYPKQFRDMYEDQALLAKLGLRYRAYLRSEWLYRYRRHPHSMVTVTNSTRDRRAMRLKFLTWLSGYVRAQRVRDVRVRWALHDELWKCRHPRLAGSRAFVQSWGGRIRRRALRTLSGVLPR